MNRVNAIRATAVPLAAKRNGSASPATIGDSQQVQTYPSFDQNIDFSASISSRDYMKIPLDAPDDTSDHHKGLIGSSNDLVRTDDSRNTENTPTKKTRYRNRESEDNIMVPIPENQQEEDCKLPDISANGKLTPLQRAASFGVAAESAGLTRSETGASTNLENNIIMRRQLSPSVHQASQNQTDIEVVSVQEPNPAPAAAANNNNPSTGNQNAGNGQNAARQAQNNRVNELNNRLEVYSYARVLRTIRTNLIAAVTFIVLYVLGMLVFKGVFSWQVPFAVFWLTCIVRSVLALRKKNRPQMTVKQKRAKYFEVLEFAIFALYLIPCALKLSNISIILIPFALFGLFGAIVFPMIYDPIRSYYKKKTLIGCKLVFWIHITLLSLKIDNIFTQWSYVFYPLLLTTFFLVAVSVGYFLVSLCYFVRNYGSEHFKVFMIGHLWELFYSLFSWPAAFSVFGTLQAVEGTANSILSVTLPIGIGHAAFFVLYTLATKTSVANFLIGPLLAEGRERISKARDRQQFKSLEESTNIHLAKISSTYYVEIPAGLNINDKNQIEDWKAQIRGAKSNTKPVPLSKRPSTQKALPPDNNEELVIMNAESQDRWTGENRKRAASPIQGLSQASRVSSAKSGSEKRYSRANADLEEQGQKKLDRRDSGDGEKQCIICFTDAPNAVIMGCGHAGMCYPCAIEAWKKDDTCMLCRKMVDKVLKIGVISGTDIAKVLVSTTKKPFLA